MCLHTCSASCLNSYVSDDHVPIQIYFQYIVKKQITRHLSLFLHFENIDIKWFQRCDWSHKWGAVWSLRPSSRAEQVPRTCYCWYGGATDQPLTATGYLSPVSPLSTRQCLWNANSRGMCPIKALDCNC